MSTTVSDLRNNTHAQWWKDPGLRKLNLLLLGAMLGGVGFGYDASLVNGLLANDRWFTDLNIVGSQMEGLVIAAQSFGAITALFPAAYVSDLIGRRPAILIANAAMIGTSIGQSFSRSAVTFLVTRAILGFFNVCVIVSTNALVAELSHPRQRPQVTALSNTFFYVGGIIAAWASYGALSIQSSWTWRLSVILQCCWPVAQSTAMVFVPESPRWLVLKGRGDEAKQVLAQYHANGAVDDDLINFEHREILAAVEAEEREAAYSWLALFSNQGNLRRSFLTLFLGLTSQWVGNGIISYYLAPVLKTVGIGSSSQQLAINGGLQVFNLFMSVPAALMAERLGRKRLLLASAGGMAIFMALLTACSATYARTGDHNSGTAVIAFIFCFFGSYDIGFTPIPLLYVSEIASTHLRTKYVSLYWMSTAVALCFNQYVNPIAFDAITWRYYIVYIAVLCPVMVVLYFFAPETKGRTLEEVAAIFEPEIAENLARADDDEHKSATTVEQREWA
ncbi:hexose transporter [Penicillium odoratum]|uniref:hexose transporter n=1 Tax=Penicillium odoratum TaxID=1167516 RepID=UPI002548FCB5|nr:hexose transporter [Penicillium odoratum]KAJ5759691.1 hexose transporter [Penicillium odoratum]